MNALNKPVNSDITVRRQVMNAIRKLQGKKGISLRDLKKYLKDSKKMDVVSNDVFIKLSLKNSMDRGILTRNDGNYKLIEARRRRSRKSSKGRKTSGRRRRRRSSGRKGRSRRKRSSRRKSSGRRRSRRRRRKSPAAEEM